MDIEKVENEELTIFSLAFLGCDNRQGVLLICITDRDLNLSYLVSQYGTATM